MPPMDWAWNGKGKPRQGRGRERASRWGGGGAQRGSECGPMEENRSSVAGNGGEAEVREHRYVSRLM
eukprot:7391191-Prymnesium_polylepis.2